MARPSPEQVSKMRDKFAKLDRSGDWRLDFPEMCSMLRSGNPGLTDKELLTLYQGIDKNHDGQVSFDEFVRYVFNNATTNVAGRPHGRDVDLEQSRGREDAPREARRSDYAKADGVEYRCSWCRKPVCRKVSQNTYYTRRDGTTEPRTVNKIIEDDQVCLRLPGVAESATLHTNPGCREAYIDSHALRCRHCSEPILKDLVIVERLETGEKVELHADCVSRFEGDGGRGQRREDRDDRPRDDRRSRDDSRQRQDRGFDDDRGRSNDRGLESTDRRQSTRDRDAGSSSPHRAWEEPEKRRGGSRPRPHVSDDSRCYQCGESFRHVEHHRDQRGFGSRTTEEAITDAKTRLQLPGLTDMVTLHSEGSCIRDYVEENAFRCEQCKRPIEHKLTRVQLPWSKVNAVLHEGCQEEYGQAFATRCSHCDEPILTRGIRVRGTGRGSLYLHEQCEAYAR
eukprot:TRINITY_DN58908_c0_g1_i1.p1 TRINITY_DN58908_c0_g1~~TRINITY_DN58908_c0_g1_i1.p1  ORF type:complete len:452 (+),score=61.74 TRINITY_DN58908_c0_g1_i1:110-1465(+)